MKIGQVNNYCRGMHRYLGGAENALYRTARIARDQGHDVFIAALRPDVEKPSSEFRFWPLRRWENYLPRLAARYAEPVKWYVWQRDIWASRDFQRVMAIEKPDLVHFHNIQFPGLDLIRIAKEAGARTCLTIYDYWLFCPNVMLLTGADEYCRRFHGAWCVDCLPRLLRPVQRFLLARRKAVFDRYIRMVDRWIVLSHHSATVLEAYGIPRNTIRVVRLTLPFEFASLDPENSPSKGSQVIFFAGWLQKRKGVHVLLEAMPEIVRQCPQARLRVAGHETKFDWEYKALIRKLMERPGMKEWVTFLGALSPAQVEQELWRCGVVTIPEQYENMSPLLMIEAMALQKPLVISRAGGIPEFVEDGVTGWLADPRRPAEFAEKIVAILQGRVEVARIGRQAREKVFALCREEDIVRATMAAYRF